MNELTSDDEFNLEEEVAALFELWDDQDFAVKVGPEVGLNADALTSLTRGRGPRRGNLEDLLKYWRPIMKKPGGFRRCVVILMDKPKFGGKPQRICAWLHHEITGKWPNEGKGKRGSGSGKRRGRRTGSVRRAGRRLKTVDIFESDVMFVALDGSQELVDLKVKRTVIPSNIRAPKELGAVGSGLSAATSFVLPGDISDYKNPVRSSIFEALTPGPPGGGRGRGLPGRRGGGAGNKFRCPPGFQAGGTFTNSNFSTCGLLVLGVPRGGPGSFDPSIASAIRELADDADLRRSIGDLSSNREARSIIENSQIPAAPKEVGIAGRQNSIDLIVSLIDADPGLDLGRRFVRRDGVVLDIALPNSTLAGLGEFDDMNDGVIVLNDNLRKGGQIGQEIVPVMGTGLRAVVFHVPGEGTMSLRRVGGDMTDEERNGLNAQWAASLTSSQRRSSDPTAAIRNFVENSDGRYILDENISSGGAGEDNETAFNRELVVVESDDAKITVPRWVFELYLGSASPRREEGSAVYSLVEDSVKMAELSRFAVVKYDVVPDATHERHGWSDAAERVALFNEAKNIGGKAGRSIPDPSGKFRCPVGSGGGGQFTDSNGTTCGARIAANVIERLYDTGRALRVPDHEIGRGSKRKRPVRTPLDGSVVNQLGEAGHDFDEVLAGMDVAAEMMRDSVQGARSAGFERHEGLGVPIGEALPDRSALSPDDAFMLKGDSLVDSLGDINEMLDATFDLDGTAESIFENASPALRLEVFGRLEDLANVEAARRGVSTDDDREVGHQRIFDLMMDDALATVAPGSGGGPSSDRDTAAAVRRFSGSETLSDMPAVERVPEIAAVPETVDAPSDKPIDVREIPDIIDFMLANAVEVDDFVESAEFFQVAQRANEDRDVRIAKVNTFLNNKYPEGTERPWEAWKDKGEEIVTMSGEEREALVKEMWSLGVEIPGGEYKVKTSNGKQRDVRMTITPQGDYYEEEEGFTTTIGFAGEFQRKFYDVDTGEMIGFQNAGNYERSFLVDLREGRIEVGHEYMMNTETIEFQDRSTGAKYTGGSVTGAGLSKELNYPAYAYYEALSPKVEVYVATADQGGWIWPRQGINEIISSRSLDTFGNPMEPTVDKFVSIPEMDVFKKDSIPAFGDDFYDQLVGALVAPTPEHRERLRELGATFKAPGGGFTNRDVQLAMENPVDGVDAADMTQISRSMMISNYSIDSEIKNRAFFSRNEGPVRRVLEASGIKIDGETFDEWWPSLDPEDRDAVILSTVRKLNNSYRSLGLSSGKGKIVDLIDTGIR